MVWCNYLLFSTYYVPRLPGKEHRGTEQEERLGSGTIPALTGLVTVGKATVRSWPQAPICARGIRQDGLKVLCVWTLQIQDPGSLTENPK